MKLKGKRIAWVAIPLLVALLPVALLLTASSAVGQQEIPTIEEAAIQVGLVVTGTQEMKVLERPYRNTDSVLQVGPSLVSTETLSDTIYAPLIVNKWPWAPELLVLFGVAVIENFGYRQLNTIWRVIGLMYYLRNVITGVKQIDRR